MHASHLTCAYICVMKTMTITSVHMRTYMYCYWYYGSIHHSCPLHGQYLGLLGISQELYRNFAEISSFFYRNDARMKKFTCSKWGLKSLSSNFDIWQFLNIAFWYFLLFWEIYLLIVDAKMGLDFTNLYLTWNIWKERDQRTFEGPMWSPLQVLSLIKEEIGLVTRATGCPVLPQWFYFILCACVCVYLLICNFDL
jgi:hypothetical protein